MGKFEELRDKYFEKEYKMYIDGKWVDAVDGEKLEVVCPCNREHLTNIPKGNEKDVDLAVKAAWKAWPAWAAMSQLDRSKILNKVADRLEEHATEIDWCDSLEVGKTRSPWGPDVWRYYAGVTLTDEGIANTTVDYRINMVLHEPIGVVGLISAWNGPFIMACMKIPVALAAGNCVVYRPSATTPVGTLLLAKYTQDLLPPGVLNVVTGPSSTCGQAILDHPGIHKISFTGSAETGVTVALSAAKKLVPATLELGGKSASIVYADCNLKKAITGLFIGTFMMTGQMCAGKSRILIQEDIYDTYLSAALQMANAIKVGPIWEDGVTMGPVHEQAQFDKILKYFDIGRSEGAKFACGGHALTDGELAKGWYIAPTIMEGTNNMRIAQEEIFGPCPTFIKFKTEADAIAMANDSEYGLAGAVWTNDINKALRTARGVRTGSMWINTNNQLMPGYPFGGYKHSGYGREMHKSTMEHFQQVKSIVINTSEDFPV